MSAPVVTQADQELAERFWRVHPNEILATGMTREQWYAHHIAAYRLATEAALKAREVELVGALEAAADRLERAAYIISDERLTTLADLFFGYADQARALLSPANSTDEQGEDHA